MQEIFSVNPANNQINGSLKCTSSSQIETYVRQAQKAKYTWGSYPIQRRVHFLLNVLETFKKYEKEILFLTQSEMGKTLTDCKEDLGWDFDYFQKFLENGPNYIADEYTVNDTYAKHRIIYEPKGVAACIVPWNFPFANFVWSVIPNLLVGNTVLFKHSEVCPLFGKLMEDIMQSCNLPDGVFSVVHGGKDVGEMLLQQPVDLIWFTGSTKVGRQIYEMAGRRFIKAIMEMGGSNPAIVCEDVAIDDVIPRLIRGRFTNCGQVCDAIKRIFVHRNKFNELVEKITQQVKSLRLGDPSLETTQIGPLATLLQLDLLESQVNDSVKLGAVVETGGRRLPNSAGAYYEPTVLTNVNSSMRVWQEETFGPVLPIIAFDTEEQAIQMANDTIYGLGAHVFCSDLQNADRIAAQIQAGFVDINNGNHWRECNPFGGHKLSGIGVEHGRLGFQDLCKIKIIAQE